jgi:hypothetical protein
MNQLDPPDHYGEGMASRVETLRTNVTWSDALAILVVGVLGYFKGAAWTAILCACAMAISIGVWRAVRFLGKLLEYAKLDAGVYDDEESES